MIYKYVTTPTEARDDMVSFYWEVLRDCIENGDEPQSVESYLEEVRADAYNEPVDDFGHELKELILKATEQSTTTKKLREVFEMAQSDPAALIELCR
jgi:hypothetical protein